MLRDRYDLPVTTASSATIVALDAYTADWIGYGTGLRKIVEAADADPDCAYINAQAAAVHMALEATSGFEAARPYLARARAAAPRATQREQLFLLAAFHWLEGETAKSVSCLRQLLKANPADIAAAKWGQYHAFNLGDSAAVLAFAESIMPAHAQTGEAWGMRAFGLEMNDRLEDAEAAGRRALSLNRGDPWAHHAIAHVMEAQGRIDEGVEFLRDYQHTWRDRSIFIREHNYWHKALFHLDRDEPRAALTIFDDHLWGSWPEFAQEQIGAISTLWRLELRGVDVGSRWTPIVEQVAARGPEHILPLHDVHFIYALVRGGRIKEAEALGYSLAYDAHRGDRNVWQTVATPLVRGVAAYGMGAYDVAADLLAPTLNQLHRLGGSQAQRDVFVQAWIDAALRDGQYSAVSDLLTRRLNARPNVAVTKRLLNRARGPGQPATRPLSTVRMSA